MDTHERELIELMMMIDVPIVWEHDENDSSHDVAAFLRNSQFISGRAQRLARTAGVLARQKKTIVRQNEEIVRLKSKKGSVEVNTCDK